MKDAGTTPISSQDLSARLALSAPITIRACLVGERLHLRGLYEAPLEFSPMVLPAGAGGLVMLFRYGVVVMIGMSEAETKAFLKTLRPRIEKPLRRMETEAHTGATAP